MSLADEIEIRIAGNLSRPVTTCTRDGQIRATTTIVASPIVLVDGLMAGRKVALPLEVRGAANAAAFAARAGVGSRVILRGTLEHAADSSIIVVVQRLLHVSPPTKYSEEI